MDTKEFKSVIEDIVDAKMARKGITKFMSAVVKTVHEDGSVDVYNQPVSLVCLPCFTETHALLSFPFLAHNSTESPS